MSNTLEENISLILKRGVFNLFKTGTIAGAALGIMGKNHQLVLSSLIIYGSLTTADEFLMGTRRESQYDGLMDNIDRVRNYAYMLYSRNRGTINNRFDRLEEYLEAVPSQDDYRGD